MVIKMANYGLKNMLIWLKKTVKYGPKNKKSGLKKFIFSNKLRFTFIDKYSCHFVDLDDLRNTVSSFLAQIIFNVR